MQPPLFIAQFGSIHLFAFIFSDAAEASQGFAVLIEGVVYRSPWTSEAADKSSGFRELIPILFTIRKLKELGYHDSLVIFTMDNLADVICINKGSCNSSMSLPVLRAIFQEAHQRRLLLIGDWIPRSFNGFCDYFSTSFLDSFTQA